MYIHIYAYCLMPNHVHLLVCEKDWKVGEINSQGTVLSESKLIQNRPL